MDIRCKLILDVNGYLQNLDVKMIEMYITYIGCNCNIDVISVI